jgi:hypothetical protein
MSWFSKWWKKSDVKGQINAEIKKYIADLRVPILLIVKQYLVEPLAGEVTNKIMDALYKEVDKVW